VIRIIISSAGNAVRMEEKRNICRILVGKPDGNILQEYQNLAE
jgi:hypothetical protein